MSNRKLSKAIQDLIQEIWKLQRSMSKRLIDWLLRAAFVATRKAQANGGFVLPTTVLLILVVSLTVGALTYRAYSRNTQVIGQNQQRVLYNAATPAIDRARSKLEFMFDASRDTRYPGGVPSENQLVAMLINDGQTGGLARLTLPQADANGNADPYTLPDETRLNIGTRTSTDPRYADQGPDNAWSFRTDTNGDGKEDATVVYSIFFSTPAPSGNYSFSQMLTRMKDADKASGQLVRLGPMSSESQGGCQVKVASGSQAEGGWFPDASSTSILRKNFQVDAFVIPDDPKNAGVTLEFQQDRQLNRGNKWGAWFRDDLEIFPGPPFRWNGAMHTEGNLVLGGPSFQAFLISARASCLFYPSASIISTTNTTPQSPSDTDMDFQGQVLALGKVGTTGSGNPGDVQAAIHVQVGQGYNASNNLTMSNDTSGATSRDALFNLLSSPERILAADKYKSVGGTSNRAGSLWSTFQNGPFSTRIVNQKETPPYVDDLYRADNRWGPKPRYGPNTDDQIPANQQVGDLIPTDKTSLIADDPPSLDASPQVGYDGYWERRARNEGLRVLVGERLEVGNPYGWTTARDTDGNNYIQPPNATTGVAGANQENEGDPLYPPSVKPYPTSGASVQLTHLQQQNRSLSDNPAAVQSAAVYHGAVDRDYPVACLASTVHPGSADSLRRSIDFFPSSFKVGKTASTDYLYTNFLVGRGTNGLEFAPPGGDKATFLNSIKAGQPLRIALENLANFAGDPDGAFPPKPNDTVVHPYPALSMWGNFSNLRRALAKLSAASDDFSKLSTADKTYIQTAACTIGMLAYNVDQIQKFDPTNPAYDLSTWNGLRNRMFQLGKDLYELMDGDLTNGEVLTPGQMAKSTYNPSSTTFGSAYNAFDYYDIPPEVFLAELRRKIQGNTNYDPSDDAELRLAEMVMLNFQVRRDRTFGFRSSPSFGNYVIYTQGEYRVFPTACDPDMFVIPASGDSGFNNSQQISVNYTDPANPQPKDLTGPFGLPPKNQLPVALSGDSTSTGNNLFAQSRLGLSRLCGALEFPRDTTGRIAYRPTDPTLDPLSSSYDPTALRPTVKPKYPALYYLFPEQDHGLQGEFTTDTNNDYVADAPGEYDHRQPGHPDFGNAGSAFSNKSRAELVGMTITQKTGLTGSNSNGAYNKISGDREPYVVDDYVKQINTSNSVVFKRVQNTPKANLQLVQAATPYFTDTKYLNSFSLSTLTVSNGPTNQGLARFPDKGRTVFPVPDLAVDQVALQPVTQSGAWQISNFKLPTLATPGTANPNRITLPNTGQSPETIQVSVTTPNYSQQVAIPFLDKAIYDPRQLMLERLMDVDIGLLRTTKPSNQTAGNTAFAPDDVWLPVSGIVYAFREDAVREDAISRPVNTAQNTMDLRDPSQPMDPQVPITTDNRGVSLKPIDYLPDPYRRSHGFRLKNGVDLQRDSSLVTGNFKASDNYRGISFFTDQPVYMAGNFNLHQDSSGNPLEEFKEQIQGTNFNAAQFYDNRKTPEPNFARPDTDRWRPAEILADSISILSSNFCDGSINDYYLTLQGVTLNNKVYTQNGLYDPGCSAQGRTSFQNSSNPQTKASTGWVTYRGNSYLSLAPSTPIVTNSPPTPATNLTTPADPAVALTISRTGVPLLMAPPTRLTNPLLPPKGWGYGDKPAQPMPVAYSGSYSAIANGSNLISASDTRINAIVVSGIPPSRKNQSYGGLHNFPRFVEDWGNFYFAGSFLQLSFSNYATSPFELEALELNTNGTLADATTNEPIGYYGAPNRYWGYDVALQLAPAGPAAARFVNPSSTRNEFYNEPPVNDPYISQLCQAAKTGKVPNLGRNPSTLICPT